MNPHANAKHSQIRQERENRNCDDREHRTQKDSSQSFSQAERWLGFCHEAPIISPLFPCSEPEEPEARTFLKSFDIAGSVV